MLAIISGCDFVPLKKQAQGESQSPVRAPSEPQRVPDQSTLCVVSDFNPAEGVLAECVSGQKVLFAPPVYGNEQFPVLFAARYCDLRYNVVITVGAVACIYLPTTEAPQRPAHESTAEPAPRQPLNPGPPRF